MRSSHLVYFTFRRVSRKPVALVPVVPDNNQFRPDERKAHRAARAYLTHHPELCGYAFGLPVHTFYARNSNAAKHVQRLTNGSCRVRICNIPTTVDSGRRFARFYMLRSDETLYSGVHDIQYCRGTKLTPMEWCRAWLADAECKGLQYVGFSFTDSPNVLYVPNPARRAELFSLWESNRVDEVEIDLSLYKYKPEVVSS